MDMRNMFAAIGTLKVLTMKKTSCFFRGYAMIGDRKIRVDLDLRKPYEARLVEALEKKLAELDGKKVVGRGTVADGSWYDASKQKIFTGNKYQLEQLRAATEKDGGDRLVLSLDGIATEDGFYYSKVVGRGVLKFNAAVANLADFAGEGHYFLRTEIITNDFGFEQQIFVITKMASAIGGDWGMQSLEDIEAYKGAREAYELKLREQAQSYEAYKANL